MKPGLGRFNALGEAATLRLYQREDMAAYSAAKDETSQEEARRSQEAHGVNVVGVLLTSVCPDCGGSGKTAGAPDPDFQLLTDAKYEKLSPGEKSAYTKSLRKHEAKLAGQEAACMGCVNSPVPGRVCHEVNLAEFLMAVFNPQALR